LVICRNCRILALSASNRLDWQGTASRHALRYLFWILEVRALSLLPALVLKFFPAHSEFISSSLADESTHFYFEFSFEEREVLFFSSRNFR
jgi:hypothetical protein